MSWIKLQNSIWENPKVDYIAHECDMPVEWVVGLIARVWSWFDQHTENGETTRIGSAKVRRIISTSVTHLRYNGNTTHIDDVTKTFIKCLIEVEWLAENDDNLILPGWESHNGPTAKNRALGQKRQEKSRSNKKFVTDVTHDRDNCVTREEKRREEKRREEIESSGSVRSIGDKKNQNLTGPDLQNWLSYFEIHGAVFGLTQSEWEMIWNVGNASGWRNTQGNEINWKSWGSWKAKNEVEKRKSKNAGSDLILEAIAERSRNAAS